MHPKFKNLPYRSNVGIMLINDDGHVFVGQRLDNNQNAWQMPQGGVNKDEGYLMAMKRELHEETGITSIKVLKELDQWFEYELPKSLLGIIWKGKYRGQKQKWFIVKFTGKDSEIDLKTKHPEFIEWKWVEMDELPKIIVDFKKDVYEKLLLELKKFIC